MNLKILNFFLAGVLVILIGIWGFLIINPREMRPPDFNKELGINEQQMRELNNIRDRIMSEDRAIFLKIHGLNKELTGELSKNEIDDAAIRSIEEKLQTQHKKLTKLRISAVVESRKVLGAEKFIQMTGIFDKKRKEGPLRNGKNRDFPGKNGDNGPPPPPPGEFGF